MDDVRCVVHMVYHIAISHRQIEQKKYVVIRGVIGVLYGAALV